ncbi:hypothetical protein B0H13DRAFT_2543854 [Mycena leptocephala]|nr:hypothetical protein B0H13DRAFT_2543854 [Mycena leptocephala]
MDLAVLARNVILLTLIADNQTASTIMWNIFYHMRLDSASFAVLVSHCQKLLAMSAILKQWCSSPYSHFIGMCTQYTLTELCHHWSLYEAMQNLSPQRISAVERAFSEVSREAAVLERHLVATFNSARSAGPLMAQALRVCGDQSTKYWDTGGSFTSEAETRNSKLLNPMFAYSLGGEGCSINSIADPLVSFHLASALGNSKQELTVMNIVVAAKTQFEGWCSSFHKAIVASESAARSTMIVRFFVGEATAVCHSLRTYSTTGALAAGHTDLSNLALLVGICPVGYVSGFSSRSNVHELIIHDTHNKKPEDVAQFHRMTSWKSPSSANDFGPHTSNEKHLLPIFDTEQLGTCLYDMYRHAFEKKPSYLARLDSISMQRAFAISNLVTEIRETFVLFLKLFRDRLEIPETRWSEMMKHFFTLLQEEDEAIDHYHRHDFYTRSHLHGIGIGFLPSFASSSSSRGKIVLSSSSETPLLQCEFKGTALRQVFALQDKPSTECDTIIFISAVKFDLASHTLVCDRYILPLTPARINIISGEFGRLIREGNIFNVGVYDNEMKAWKPLLPAFAKRCRSWKHTSNCEYTAQGKVPLSEEMHIFRPPLQLRPRERRGGHGGGEAVEQVCAVGYAHCDGAVVCGFVSRVCSLGARGGQVLRLSRQREAEDEEVWILSKD